MYKNNVKINFGVVIKVGFDNFIPHHICALQYCRLHLRIADILQNRKNIIVISLSSLSCLCFFFLFLISLIFLFNVKLLIKHGQRNIRHLSILRWDEMVVVMVKESVLAAKWVVTATKESSCTWWRGKKKRSQREKRW